MEKPQTLSDEITKSWGNDEIKWLHQDNVKKHLQEFKEELKIELFRCDVIMDDEPVNIIIDTQMQKHFGNKLLK